MYACINEDEILMEKFKNIGLDMLFPCGSFAIGCLRKSKLEYDLIAHYISGSRLLFLKKKKSK
jgi:hypothetical protein